MYEAGSALGEDIRSTELPLRISIDTPFPEFLSFGQNSTFAFNYKTKNGGLVPDVLGGDWDPCELENLRLWATSPHFLEAIESFNLGINYPISSFHVIVDMDCRSFSVMNSESVPAYLKGVHPPVRLCRRKGVRGDHARLIKAYRERLSLVPYLSVIGS